MLNIGRIVYYDTGWQRRYRNLVRTEPDLPLGLDKPVKQLVPGLKKPYAVAC